MNEEVKNIRDTYSNDEWFKPATDSDIVTAWGRRSEDSCASWLGFEKGVRDEIFEEYLKEILVKKTDPKEELLRLHVQVREQQKRLDMALERINKLEKRLGNEKGSIKQPS